MSNLLITVISIALVAVIAIVGIFYGGAAFSGSQGKAYAAMLLTQSRQLMGLSMQYMLDHNYSDFNAFGPDALIVAGYIPARIPILSMDVEGISNSYYHTLTPTVSASNIAQGTCSGSGNTPEYLGGYQIYIQRANANTYGRNVIIYNFFAMSSSYCDASSGNQTNGAAQDLSPASMANHPLVQMCLALNAMTPLPAGLTYSASGLPEAVATASWKVEPDNSPYGLDYYDGWYAPVWWTNGSVWNTIFDHCYIGADGIWGSGYDEMFFLFSN